MLLDDNASPNIATKPPQRKKSITGGKKVASSSTGRHRRSSSSSSASNRKTPGPGRGHFGRRRSFGTKKEVVSTLPYLPDGTVPPKKTTAVDVARPGVDPRPSHQVYQNLGYPNGSNSHFDPHGLLRAPLASIPDGSMALGGSIHGLLQAPLYSPTPRGSGGEGGDRSTRRVSQFPARPTQD